MDITKKFSIILLVLIVRVNIPFLSDMILYFKTNQRHFRSDLSLINESDVFYYSVVIESL